MIRVPVFQEIYQVTSITTKQKPMMSLSIQDLNSMKTGHQDSDLRSQTLLTMNLETEALAL
jgi:hypothetical protein